MEREAIVKRCDLNHSELDDMRNGDVWVDYNMHQIYHSKKDFHEILFLINLYSELPYTLHNWFIAYKETENGQKAILNNDTGNFRCGI